MKISISDDFVPNMISGKVLPGINKGTETGARTANLDIALAHDLPKGLYACTVKIATKEYRGLLYYGYNSLRKADCLEIHILNFSDDIYGQIISATTTKFIRPEKIFNDIESLKKQIAKDIKEAIK